jgi:hypothetical protein
MIEASVERYFVQAVRQLGGHAHKLSWPGTRGAPDRDVFMPLRKWSCRVELKRPRGKPEDHQTRAHEMLRLSGVEVFVLDTKEKIDLWVRDVQWQHPILPFDDGGDDA